MISCEDLEWWEYTQIIYRRPSVLGRMSSQPSTAKQIYYMSLAASAATFVQATPSSLSAPSSPDFDDFGGNKKKDQKLNNGIGLDLTLMDTDNDPIIYINGKPVAFSKVTEGDYDLMTPKEYTAYFKVMQMQEI
ncbi:uncharacterized protein BT62DRAFT_919320 [Guyanagaster necrorhizus]|uniref:Transcription factor TFIIE alpha subunit C-terminal domain-containing protein n=1 Tax=Guyanagaster necrorhizus TaxID=856835 RepID=A0A9P7VVM5_9AGAR|nr:uncharacterized protein BT62DRAFT_919320 [Guyanagaster necrorhizus MCA 3950]KAG7446711.1 hypothetical protein BT62DRAFT_919320 [Guyanagaster necrorhizus MCA 3950]